jgi:homoserine O-acetyltransferase/O-succinyltransferase
MTLDRPPFFYRREFVAGCWLLVRWSPRSVVSSVVVVPVLEEGICELPQPLPLHFGGELAHVRIAYRLAGRADGPAVAVLGGISAGRRVFAARPGESGWWDGIVGPGCPLDTDRYRILGIDFLGGSHDSTGPATGEVFPSISAYDQAECLAAVMDQLGVERLRGCVGASYGGMVTLALAEVDPARLERAVVISAAHRTHPMSTAWRSVQRNFVRYAIDHGEGGRGLVLARALAMATYRSAREFEDRFPGPAERRAEDGRFVFPVEGYLVARGESYAAHYRPEAFVCLSESIDLHRLEPERVTVPLTLVGVVEDQLVPIADMRTLRDRAGGTCQLVEISSLYGHDAFLKETEVLRDVFAQSLEY